MVVLYRNNCLQLLNYFEGHIVRIAPNEYSIDDLDAVRTIYGSGKGFIKVVQTLVMLHCVS